MNSNFTRVFVHGMIAVGLGCAFAPSSVLAAIPTAKEPKADGGARGSSRISVEMTKSALGLPMANRLQALQEQGPQGYRNLVSIMFNEAMSMDARWRAVTAAGRIGGELSKPELEKALKNKDWFMRNAGLIAMANIDRAQGTRWARELLSDKALVVRAAAVDTLVDLKDASSTALLWEKLYSKENYKGKQSLFIRRQIVEALASLEAPGREGKFIQVLADNDESLHVPAIKALERLTKQTVGNAKDPMKVRRAQWQRWWDENKAQM